MNELDFDELIFTVNCGGDWDVFCYICGVWFSCSEQALWWDHYVSRDFCDVGTYCYGHGLHGWTYIRSTF